MGSLTTQKVLRRQELWLENKQIYMQDRDGLGVGRSHKAGFRGASGALLLLL